MTAASDAIEEACAAFDRVRRRLTSVVIGQDAVVDHLLVALLANGHVLLEGSPGLGKTLLVRTLAETLDLRFRRVQCTPDLLPSDVTGSLALVDGPGGATVAWQEGPVFTNVLLADEVNRTTPKTQSALLEAMEERTVTAGGVTRPLPDPFLVLATQNPIDLEGTYPLPEAQLDRFLLKIVVPSPDVDTLTEILRRVPTRPDVTPPAVLDSDALRRACATAAAIAVAPALLRQVAELVRATHPTAGGDANVGRFVRYGASPRGALAIVASSRARALLAGRPHVARSDLSESSLVALRHRLILGFEAEAEGVTADEVLRPLIERAFS